MSRYADHVIRTEKSDQSPTEVDRFKGGFFDRKTVSDALGVAATKALRKSAGRIRLIAKRSMRYRNKPSAPGQPPSAHRKSFVKTVSVKGGKVSVKSDKGPLLKEFLFFAFDVKADSVVVGPVQLGKSIVKSLHEFGGKVGSSTYPKRPFMKPALDQELPNISKEIRM